MLAERVKKYFAYSKYKMSENTIPEMTSPNDVIPMVTFLPTLSPQDVITIVTMLAGSSIVMVRIKVNLKKN